MPEAATRSPGVQGWCRPLERLVFAFPAGVAGGFVSAPLVDRPLFLVAAAVAGGVLALGWTVALAVVVYLDASAVTEAGVGWEPSRVGYAATVTVVPVAALHYLSRRHRHVAPSGGSDRWWFGIPIAALALVVPFPPVIWAGAPPAAVLVGPAVGLVLLPAAVYRDAGNLQAAGAPWQPDPAVQFAVATVATLLVVPQPVYVGYYLRRRWRARRGP